MRYQICLKVLAFSLIVSITSCSAQNNAGLAQTKTYGKVVEIAKLSEARATHSATLLTNGKVLIAGGMERNGVFFDAADIFDPETNSFARAKGKMNSKRAGHAAAILPDGRVLMTGGWTNRDQPEMSAEIYDPQTETFKTVGKMNFRRAGHSITLLDNGKVLITGGFDGTNYLSEAEIFDPLADTFTLIGKMQNERSGHPAVKMSDGKILLTGGAQRGERISATAEIFDPTTNKFSLLKNSMTTVRYKHDAVLLADHRVLILGGSDSRDWQGKYKSAEIFNPKTGEFTASGEMNYARFKIDGTAVLLNDGRVFIGGGGAAAELFDPNTNSFAKIEGNFGGPFHYASVTLLNDGRALIVGGYGNGTRAAGPVSTNQAWIFKL